MAAQRSWTVIESHQVQGLHPDSDREDRTMDSLKAAVENSGGNDNTAILALADYLDELGWGVESYTLRWCVVTDTWPFHRSHIKRYPWEWTRMQKSYSCTKSELTARARSMLPTPIFDYSGGDGWALSYKSCWSAIKELAVRIGNIRNMLEVNPDQLPERVVKPREIEMLVCKECGIARNACLEVCPVCKAVAQLNGGLGMNRGLDVNELYGTKT